MFHFMVSFSCMLICGCLWVWGKLKETKRLAAHFVAALLSASQSLR